ncbi:MAG TPA: PEP-CTERM sorting domain-containing protein [Pirellulales bacterium]|jgi:hypothetical protein|nr:PEP-CTERM sorting domain-containing protein [Pirellulales bacterium]
MPKIRAFGASFATFAGCCALSLSLAAMSAGTSAAATVTGFSGFAPVNGSGGSYTNSLNSFQLTDGGNSEGSSGFNSTPVNISAFTATYTYQASGGADGAAFIIQNDSRGTSAVGDAGGALGYGGGSAIQPSVAFELNLYTGGPVMGEALGVNGSTGTYNPVNPGLSLNSNNPIMVNLNYDGAKLLVSLRDTVSGNGYTTTYTGSLPTFVGGSTALIGFSGGTGGITSTQTISNFTYTNDAPIYRPIGVTGFNQKMIVPQGATPATPFTGLTASMDDGTGLMGSTFYEQGFNTGSPRTGVAHPGTPFVSANDPNHIFQLASDFTQNDALLLDGTSSGSPATLNLASSAKYSNLSLLVSTGGGTNMFSAVVHYANNTTETFSSLTSPDWFNPGPVAYVTEGRVNGTGGFDAVNSGNPRLFQVDLALSDSLDNVTSIDFFNTSGNGHAVVLGVSGVAVPEPSSLLLLGAGLLGFALFNRRRLAS